MHASSVAVVAMAAAAVAAAAGAARAQAARHVEPVVLTGARLPGWSRLAAQVVCAPYPSGTTGGRDAHNGTDVVPPDVRSGVPVDQIAAFRWEGLQFVEIPVQVDQRYHYCLSNPPSDFALYSGTDKELTYAWDVESWKKTAGECIAEYPPGVGPTPDPVPTLDDDDEIVFMASDAGPPAPLAAPAPPGATAGHAVALVDPLAPATVRFVYLFLRPGGSSYDATNGHVSYARDPDADEWIDRFSIRADDPEILGVSNTGYGPNLAGTVCRTASFPGYPAVPDGTPRPSTDRFVRDGVTVSTAAYEWRASGRWMVRGLRVARPGQPGVYGPDLIDRWKGRAFQQSPDSSISLVGFEDEQVNWEANSALLGERGGAVRAIRETWGADSGTNVTKTEIFYRDAIAYRYHVRVHPIPPDGLYTSWDYNHDVAARYYNVLKPDGVPIDGMNDDVGNVDGVFGFPAYFDVPDPTFNAPSALLNWEQVAGRDDAGALVYIVELKGATTLLNPAVVPYYRDDACLDDGTGDDPVPRPWPGEASTDPRVRDGYSVANGGTPYEQLACAQRQGAWGAHGIHYFVTGDTDNAASPEVLTEIDAQQWQFAVPLAAPANVGQQYGNVVTLPLVATALPLFGVPLPTTTTTMPPAATTTTSLVPPVTTTTTLPPDAPPSAGDVAVTTDQDVPVEATLGGADLETCELTFAIVSPPANGMVSAPADRPCTAGAPNGDTATVTYTPAVGFSGSDGFTYRVNDGTSDSNVATVSVTVRPSPPPRCAPGPAAGCRRPSAPGRAPVMLRHGPVDARDRLAWRWAPGTATPKEDFGEPPATTAYQLCVYDADGNTLAHAAAPAGGTCGGRPCWRDTGTGFKFRRRGPENSLRLALRAGTDGRAAIVARGTGVHLDLSPLPAVQPVRVQVQSADGVCWEAVYGTPARRNDAEVFRGRAD